MKPRWRLKVTKCDETTACDGMSDARGLLRRGQGSLLYSLQQVKVAVGLACGPALPPRPSSAPNSQLSALRCLCITTTHGLQRRMFQ
jgi:hypothetical protein